jgi:hypothetical protein
MRETWSVTTLICEDLARNDPARPIVEAIGPNLVISLLMDGHQTINRWSAKYANVLAEDPGSSVLSITSLGLINRINNTIDNPSSINTRYSNNEKNGSQRDNNKSHAIALWTDDKATTMINLKDKADAVLISISEHPVTDFTHDGRADDRATSLRFSGARDIQLSNDDVINMLEDLNENREEPIYLSEIIKKNRENKVRCFNSNGDYYPPWGQSKLSESYQWKNQVLAFFDKKTSGTHKEIAGLLKVSERYALNLCKKWCEKGYIDQCGESNEPQKYELIKKIQK